MGIGLAFAPDHADFSGMTADARFFIGDAIQKAWIETNEKGTVAAAVTGVVMISETWLSENGDWPSRSPIEVIGAKPTNLL